MNFVFCVDRGVLPGLHVAAYSLLDRLGPGATLPEISVFSDVLTDADLELLKETLQGTGKPFRLSLRRLDANAFSGFRPLHGSLAAYYRLLVPQVMDVPRFLYLDADTLCDLDLSPLESLDMKSRSVAWVPEAFMAGAVDRRLAAQLGLSETEFYFNSGVILVDVPTWRRERVTEKALDYITEYQPDYHDQSALNFVLYQRSVALPTDYNFLTNMRKNWKTLMAPYGRIGKLIHFLDSPKPWNFLSELVHPQYSLWRSVLARTAMKEYQSWHGTPARKFPRTRKLWVGYRKTVKDRLLFRGYAGGWLKSVKGVS